MQIAIIDGYIDEPACLGVPPYISPHVRYLAGAVRSTGHDYAYITIDEYRQGSEKIKDLEKCDLLLLVAGAVVPGKYLGGSPVSFREAGELAERYHNKIILGGPAGRYGFYDSRTGGKKHHKKGLFIHQCKGDFDACSYDFLNDEEFSDRNRTITEQNKWSLGGAELMKQHPNYPNHMIAEIDSFRGCSRYITGGCSFCIEPGFGEPQFREQDDIIAEVKELKRNGLVNFRIGGQSCIYSYKSSGIGSKETPEPRPDELRKLFSGLRMVIGDNGILHVDNANPAVIAEYPEHAITITKYIVKYCTSGNVVAFGMESADPSVISANNLNSTPEQVMSAIQLVNEHGKQIGKTGLPALLPGLNLITGLSGETPETFRLNFGFVEEVLNKGLLLRRINIRQVAETRSSFTSKITKKEFKNFKSNVREKIDLPMLQKVVPYGTILRNVITETHKGNITFGRQLGSYPILVGIPYKYELGEALDMFIFDHGYRSITGVEYPFPINTASLSQIKTLPGLGSRRAARLVRARPFTSNKSLIDALDDRQAGEELIKIITLK